jgi:hypothetical protein
VNDVLGLFASSDAAPYAVFAVVACLVLAAAAGLVALRQKRSGSGVSGPAGGSGPIGSTDLKDPLRIRRAGRSAGKDERRRSSGHHPRRKRELPPLPEPLFGRAAQGTSAPEVPSFRLVPTQDVDEAKPDDAHGEGAGASAREL